jgi:hypothetical protein
VAARHPGHVVGVRRRWLTLRRPLTSQECLLYRVLVTANCYLIQVISAHNFITFLL